MRIWFICIKCELKSWFEMNTELSPVTKEDLICDDCHPKEKVCGNCIHFDERFVDGGVGVGYCKVVVKAAKKTGAISVSHVFATRLCSIDEFQPKETVLKEKAEEFQEKKEED